MRVTVLGEGDPEYAVVGGIHGDEPCGVRAVDALAAARPAVDRPVKLVVANERAVDRQVRYTDVDLNRSFPGDPDADAYERRLAHDLTAELSGLTTLALHSTQSHGDPFGIVDGVDDFARDVAPGLGLDALVTTEEFVEGRVFARAAPSIEVECGLQGTPEATANAHAVVEAFLRTVGVLPGAPDATAVPAFRLERAIEKPPAERYDVHVRNFERVPRDAVFATADDRTFVAEDPFYPVLLSAYGYETLFGYAAAKVDTLSPPAERTRPE
ncbi:MAG: succinylglutamate desuccinylase/aspartoacylase family protein [Halobacteriaceae archaeon]